jgi:hypothetical protein
MIKTSYLDGEERKSAINEAIKITIGKTKMPRKKTVFRSRFVSWISIVVST